jgi:hypothetical protein
MARDRSLLEREMERVELRPFTLEGFHRRRDRKRRKERLTAAAVAIAVFVVAMWFLAEQFSDRAPTPAGRPEPPSPMGSPSPVTEPSPPFTERFDSPLHGLSIGYPSGWRTRGAIEPWGHGEVAFDAPDVDVIFHPRFREDLYFALVSEPLGGQSGQDWVNIFPFQSVGICKGNGGYGGGAGTLHGNYAWFQGCDEPHGASGHVVAVATATRGYIIYLHVGDEVPATPVPKFEGRGGALKTVDLRPEDALDR